jgi:hypothetical protein
MSQIGSTGSGGVQSPETEADFDAETVVRLPLKWWQDPRVAIGAAAAIAVLALACLWLAGSAGTARGRMALLEAQADEGFLLPPSTARTVRVKTGSGVALGGGTPERVEVRIDARSNTYKVFRVSVARDDGTAVMRFDRLQRDTNGEIRFALNSTLLPPGAYTVEVEGFTWRGATEPFGKVGLRVTR